MFAALRAPASSRTGLRPARRVARLLGVLAVSLQAIGLAGIPVLDAAIEASSARTVVHVEGLNGAKCASVHVGDCLVCRTMSDRFAPATAAPVLSAAYAAGSPVPSDDLPAATGAAWHATQSRAPPA